MARTAKQVRRLAENAAEALRIAGWPVQAYSQEVGTWQIGDALFTDDALLDFAVWAPKREPPEQSGVRARREHRDLRTPLEAVEALDCIRAVLSTTSAQSANETSAAALRLIRTILDKAPRRRVG